MPMSDGTPDGDITSYVNISIVHDKSSYEYASLANKIVDVVTKLLNDTPGEIDLRAPFTPISLTFHDEKLGVVTINASRMRLFGLDSIFNLTVLQVRGR